MDKNDRINQYDFVEIIQVPEEYEGVIDLGDIGVVVEKYSDQSFEIECLTPDGSYKWSETLNRRYLSKHLGVSKTRGMQDIMQRSITLGSLIGAGFGTLIGAGIGAITRNLNGIFLGSMIGLVLGFVTGALTAALTVKTAGTTGGVGVGYYTGAVFGGIFGLIFGALIPTSLRIKAHTEGLPVLDAFAIGRFETAVLFAFLVSILDTIVGVWIGGRNSDPRNWKQ
jgi:hypothetical protein